MCDFIDMVFIDINRFRHPDDAIILVGKSLGSVPTMYLAAHRAQKIDGVVLISALATGARAFLHTPLIPDSIKKKFDNVFGNNLQKEEKISSQIFIIHGTHDSIIPVQNAHLLLANLKTQAYWPPLFVPADHNDVEEKGGAHFDEHVSEFIAHCQNLRNVQTKLRELDL